MIDSQYTELIDFLYKPLDTVSGDAYTAREIDENRTFYLIIDGMGKGLSASLSAMIMSSFINHLIDKMKVHDSFSLDMLIKESIEYMQPILLDEEVVSVDYIVIDNSYSQIQYAKFAMPVMLLQDENEKIIRLKSNNPPLNKYSSDYKISTYDSSSISKFLFYSDGIVENEISKNTTYADYIENDFASSYTREDLKNRIFKRIKHQEDDITLIFIHKLSLSENLISEKSFQSNMDNLDIANEWYTKELEKHTNSDSTYKANLSFSELFMNAFEHGNLGLSSAQKHQMLEEDTYFTTLTEEGDKCTKNILVQISKITQNDSTYLITQITDDGNGFDTQILSTIFQNSQRFNGRGVFVSRKNSFGIYYNKKGNSVLFLNKI